MFLKPLFGDGTIVVVCEKGIGGRLNLITSESKALGQYIGR